MVMSTAKIAIVWSVNGTGPIVIDIQEQIVMRAADTAMSTMLYVLFFCVLSAMITAFFPQLIIVQA
jgi:hypothetical protein